MATSRMEWKDESYRNRFLNMVPSPAIPLLLVAITSLAIKATTLSYVLYTNPTWEQMVEILGAGLLTVAAIPISMYTDMFQYPVWVWYALSFSWLTIMLVFTYLLGGTYFEQDEYRFDQKDILNLVGYGIIAVTVVHTVAALFAAGAVSLVAGGFDVVTYSKLFITMKLSWFAMPLGLFTDTFSFEPVVWLAVIIYWLAQTSGDLYGA